MRRISLIVLTAVLLIGAPRAASAQVDLTGIWAPIFHEDQVERVPGPEVGDYSGLPITDAERLRGEAWDASLLTLPEHQCKPHPSTYGFRGVGNLRIWSDIDDATQHLEIGTPERDELVGQIAERRHAEVPVRRPRHLVEPG